jgi:PAS domain S-box-containing protein
MGLVWLHNASDILIWLAYMAIPAVLVHFVRRRRDIPFSWMFLMFGLFIVACGFTHLMEVVTFFTPVYRLSGLVKLITAVVSWATVIGLIPLVPKVLALRSSQELEKEITSRKAAEEALATNEAHMRAILGAAVDGIISIDERGSIQMINPAAEKLFGYAAEELIGLNVKILMPSPFQEERDDYLAHYRATGEKKVIGIGREVLGRRKNGTIFPIDLSVAEAQLGAERIFVGVIHDITRRKQAEDVLRAHARQQMAVAELGQRALAGTDLDTLMDDAVALVAQSLNVKYARVMELLPSGQELLLRAGKGWREGAVGQETLPAGADSLAGYTLLQMEPVILEDLRTETRFGVPPFLRAHGVVSCISVVIQGAKGPFGVLAASTTTRRTFTGDEIHFLRGVANVLGMAIVRKQAEEALRHTYEELELRVHERTANLAAAIEALQIENAERRRAEERLQAFTAQLERSNRELQDFASVASHDLQEPLRKIQGFAGRLRARYAPALGDQGLDYLERMETAAERMRILIQDLLAFSRITTKAQPFAPVDLAQVARDVLSDLEGRIQQTKGEVHLDELPTLEADATQMRQLLQNLIGNALKFHQPEMAPLVKVHGQLFANGRVLARADRAHAQECCITVQDNGIGFDEKYRERIFQVFERLHGRGEYEGTGMGLAICRKIAERHGGRINAASTPGQGATFIVTLPIRHSEGGKPNE